MKITLNLSDALVTQAKSLAAQQRTSLARLVEEGLELRLKAAARSLPVYHGKGGLAARLNGLRNKDLLGAADE